MLTSHARTTTMSIVLLFVVLARVLPVQGAKQEPLVIHGSNTAILNRGTYAPRWLQYYLIRCVAKHAVPDAARLHVTAGDAG